MIHIGRITKPQGMKGEIKMIPINPASKYEKIKSVIIDNTEILIEQLRIRDNCLYLKLYGVNDRDNAESFRNKEVFVKISDLEDLEENEFYFQDLIGAEIYDEGNNFIGELIDIEQYGAADVIFVKEKTSIYSMPFIEDIFIDVKPKKVVVDIETYNDIKILDS